MTALEALSSVFVSAIPDIDSTRCLNSRHEGAECVRCVTLCPAMAIGVRDVAPEIDPDVCVTCGVCLALCPTSAITAPTGFEAALARAVEAVPEEDIGIVCAYHGDPSSVPAPTVVRHGMCLGSLDAGHLLALAVPGVRRVWLDVTPCSTCPLSAVQALIGGTVASANRLANGIDDPVGITRRRVPGGSRPVLDGTHQGLTRRDLFRSVKPRSAEADQPMIRPGAASDDRLPVGLPKARKRLLGQLDRWAPVGGSTLETRGLPFAAVEVDSTKCSGCSLCGRFCPTGSLAFHDGSGSFALGFRASLCIDCGICSVVCPEDAITFGLEMSSEATFEKDWSVLVTGPLTYCTECEEPTRGEPGDVVRCHGCRGGRVDSLHDDAGLMEDFLSRIDRLEKD